MLQILEMTRYPVPFPQKTVGEYSSPEEAMAKLGWSREEMRLALEGQIVRERFVLEWMPKYLQRLMIDAQVQEYPDGAEKEEISLILGIGVEGVKSRLSRALEKLRQRGDLEYFLHLIQEMRERQRRRNGAYGYTFRGKITVTVEG